MQSILSKEINVTVYDLIFIHAMIFLIYKLIDMLGGCEGVTRTINKLF